MVKKYQKILIILFFFSVLVGTLLYGGRYWIKQQLKTVHYIAPIRIEQIKTGVNPLRMTLQDVSLILPQDKDVLLGSFDLYLSFFPPTVQIQSAIKNPITADIRISRNRIDVKKLTGRVLQMFFQATGSLDLKQERGHIDLETTNLKTYIQKNLPDYSWISTFLTDNTVTTTIQPQNGCLNMINIPVWCYR